MFNNKPPKTEAPGKDLIIIHRCNNSLSDIPEVCWVCSIDPGRENFAIRIEERNLKENKFKMILFDLRCFKDELYENKYSVLFSQLSSYLDSIKVLLLKVKLVFIEQQLWINYKSLRIFQHILSWFVINIKEALIFEVSPTLKTRMLSPNIKRNRREVKTWSILEATNILEENNDQKSLDILKTVSKKDDLCDTIVQIKASMLFLNLKF